VRVGLRKDLDALTFEPAETDALACLWLRLWVGPPIGRRHPSWFADPGGSHG